MGKIQSSDKVRFAILMGLGSLFVFVKQLLLAKYLGKEIFGVYAYVNVVAVNLTPLLGVGILDGFSRSYPMALGVGNIDEASRLLKQSFSTLIFIGLGIFLLATLTQLILWEINVDSLIPMLAIYCVLHVFFLFFLRYFRSKLNTYEYAKIYLVKGFGDIIFCPILGHFAGTKGIILGDLLSLFVALIYGHRLKEEIFAIEKPKIAILRELSANGIVILLISFLGSQIFIFDRTIAGHILSTKAFADYGLLALVLSVFAVFSNIVTQYLSPYILRERAQSEDSSGSLKMIRKIEVGFTLGFLICFVPSYLLFELIIEKMYPDFYFDGVIYTLFYMGGVLNIIGLHSVILIALKKYQSLLLNQAICIAILAVLAFGGIYLEVANLKFFAGLFFVGRLVNFAFNRYAAVKS